MSSADDDALLAALSTRRAVRVLVVRTQGSAPRDAGTWMAVLDDAAVPSLIGTIGGGRLEFDAIEHAQALLAGTAQDLQRRYALGPSLGQCCGGVVHLRFELLERASDEASRHAFRERLDAERRSAAMPVALFGGGHVGRAIVRALSPLPMNVRWVDSRDGVFPDAAGLGLVDWPRTVHAEHCDPVHHAVRELPADSRVLIMSFSHAEDLDIVIECLLRQRARADLPFIGLIGSRSKWATFGHRLQARGFGEQEIAQVTCPIGVSGIAGKQPDVIAAAVAAQLLQTMSPSAAQGVGDVLNAQPQACAPTPVR